MWNVLLGPINAIKTILGTPASSTIAAKVDTLHDTRVTSARAGYLDLLNTYLNSSVAGVLTAVQAIQLAKIPMASGILNRPTTNAALQAIGTSGVLSKLTRADNSTTVYDTWTSLITITGAGVINYLSILQQTGGNSSSRDARARVKIDGVTVWESDANAWQAPADDLKGLTVIGDFFSGGLALDQVPFLTGLVVEFKKTENSAGTVAMTAMLAARRSS